VRTVFNELGVGTLADVGDFLNLAWHTVKMSRDDHRGFFRAGLGQQLRIHPERVHLAIDELQVVTQRLHDERHNWITECRADDLTAGLYAQTIEKEAKPGPTRRHSDGIGYGNIVRHGFFERLDAVTLPKIASQQAHERGPPSALRHSNALSWNCHHYPEIGCAWARHMQFSATSTAKQQSCATRKILV